MGLAVKLLCMTNLFLYFVHVSCGESVVRLGIFAGLFELSLLAYAISSKSCVLAHILIFILSASTSSKKLCPAVII